MDEKWEYQRLGLKQVESLRVLNGSIEGHFYECGMSRTHLNRYEDWR